MRQLYAFLKKEIMEMTRSGKLMILLVVFFLFGLMNPAIAKLTPMLKTMAESMAESGLIIGEIHVDAMTSWIQFYKNVPIAIIVFVIMQSATLTGEYQNGTLINVLTRGLPRWKVLAAKMICMTGLWTICYWMCYGVTYGYNAYFWGNDDIPSLLFAVFCIYIVGIWYITLIIWISTMAKTGTSVILGVGGIYGVGFVLTLFPKLKKFSPVWLMSSSELLMEKSEIADFYPAIAIVLTMIVVLPALSAWTFNKREL